MFRSALFVLALARGALAQQAGTLSPTESHPKLAIQQCSSAGCETLARSIVLDANWRWFDEAGARSRPPGRRLRRRPFLNARCSLMAALRWQVRHLGRGPSHDRLHRGLGRQSLPRRQARRLRVDEFSGIFQELAERLGVAAHAPAKIAVFAADGSARAAFEPREA